MLKRVDSMVGKMGEGRQALERLDVELACKKINEIFKILPDHLMGIGTKMNMFDGKVQKIEKQSREMLIDFHQKSNICAIGKIGENLDIGETEDDFKTHEKVLINLVL